VHPDDIDRTMDAYNEQRKGGKAIGFINRYRRKDGQYVTLEWYASEPDNNGIIYAIAHPLNQKT